MDGPGMTGASLGIGTRGVSKGTAEPELELTLLELWCVNGIEGEPWGIRPGSGEILLDTMLKIA